MKTIAIHWLNGNHAQDILQRGVFEGFTIQKVEVWDPIPTQGIDAHMVFLPIESTRKRIAQIHALSPDTPIINFSGIQGTSPTELVMKWVVSNIHFLFWPKMENDLKASLAKTKASPVDDVITQVLQNIEKLWIRVLEHQKEEHDEKVGVTQGLAHALFLALSEMHILPETLFVRWKAVPATTSGGMIHLNHFVERHTFWFIKKLQWGKTVREALQEIVEWGSVWDFITPNFERIYKGIMGLNGPETNIDEWVLEWRKDELIAHLERIIQLHQKELVELIANTRNGEK